MRLKRLRKIASLSVLGIIAISWLQMAVGIGAVVLFDSLTGWVFYIMFGLVIGIFVLTECAVSRLFYKFKRKVRHLRIRRKRRHTWIVDAGLKWYKEEEDFARLLMGMALMMMLITVAVGVIKLGIIAFVVIATVTILLIFISSYCNLHRHL